MNKWRRTGGVAAALGMVAVAGAQDEPEASDKPGDAAGRGRPGHRFSLSFSTGYSFAQNYRNGDGGLDRWRSTARLRTAIPFSARDRLDVGFSASYSQYRFSGTHPLTRTGEHPFREIASYSLSLTSFTGLPEPWTAVYGGAITSAGEPGADFADSLSGRAFAGVMYALSPRAQVGLGVVALYRLDDDVAILPWLLVQVNVPLGEQWRMEVGSIGGVGVAYTPAEQLTLRLGLGFDRSEYRLDTSGPVPGGAARERGFPLDLSLHWTPHPAWTLHAGIGTTVAHSIEVRDSQRRRVGKLDLDPPARPCPPAWLSASDRRPRATRPKVHRRKARKSEGCIVVPPRGGPRGDDGPNKG